MCLLMLVEDPDSATAGEECAGLAFSQSFEGPVMLDPFSYLTPLSCIAYINCRGTTNLTTRTWYIAFFSDTECTGYTGPGEPCMKVWFTPAQKCYSEDCFRLLCLLMR